MQNSIYFWCWLIVLSLWQPMAVYAETSSTGTSSEIKCEISKPYEGELFISLYKSTEETAKSLCAAVVASKFNKSAGFDMAPILVDFAKKSKESLDRLNLNNSADYATQFSALKDTFSTFEDLKSSRFPMFNVDTPASGNVGYFQPLADIHDRFRISESSVCSNLLPSNSSCLNVFKEFEEAFNPYRSSYNDVFNNSDLLAKLAGRWDKFLEASKSQTSLEVGLTTWWFEREWWGLVTPHFKKDYLVEPPPYQLVAIHPQLIYDFSTKSSAQDEVGLAVEWIGANFWDWKVPVGASFTTAYVSRSGVNDFGHGVMLHLYNSYAAGWSRHGGVDTFYFTIDLLKAVQSKKSLYDKYMDYL